MLNKLTDEVKIESYYELISNQIPKLLELKPDELTTLFVKNISNKD